MTDYDRDAGAEVERNAVICPELTNKYFGALIQIETDAYMKDGSPKEIDKATFFGVYQFKTLLTPNEILNGETAAKQIHSLKEKLDSAKPRFTKQHKELMGGKSVLNWYTPKNVALSISFGDPSFMYASVSI